MNLAIAQMPTIVLQILHIGIMQKIRLRVEIACRELIKVTYEKAKIQQKYTTALHDKSEVEEKVNRVLKEKNEAEEKAEKALKEKEETEKMAQRIQMAILNIYKEIPEVPMVVEAIMKEQLSRINEAIKGFRTKIEDLQSRSMSGIPPEERAEKNLDEKCAKLCEEST
jgi:type IV secretory pathway VirB4 component